MKSLLKRSYLDKNVDFILKENFFIVHVRILFVTDINDSCIIVKQKKMFSKTLKNKDLNFWCFFGNAVNGKDKNK